MSSGSDRGEDSVLLTQTGQEEPWSNLQGLAGRLRADKQGNMKVDNVRWGLLEEGPSANWAGIFADAQIDPKHIKNIYLGVKPFNPKVLVAHDVLIFEMDEQHPITNSQGKKDSALVLSMEARLGTGEKYSMGKTMNGTYPVVYQLQTWSDLVQKTTRREGLEQHLYKLDLNQEQKEQLLKNSLQAACDPRPEERYGLVTNSCHTAAYQLVNTVIEPEQKVEQYLVPHVLNPLGMFPALADVLYSEHKLLAEQSRLVIQPDATLHPDKVVGQGFLEKTLRAASSSKAWGGACLATGAVGGSLAALAITQISPWLSVPVAAVVGAKIGQVAGDTIERRTHSNFLDAASAAHMSPSQAFEAARPS